MIQFDSITIVLLSVLLVFFIIQVIYYSYYLSKPLNYQKGVDEEDSALNNKPAVSVIICAKNESKNLAAFLPLILEQEYPLYEVIVINDGSTDETDELLGSLESKYKHLYQTYVPPQAKCVSRKKLGVTVGIKAAKYDVLLFTEANCKPLSKDWIFKMVRRFDAGTEFVLGFNAMSKSSGLFTKFAAFDNLFSGLQYLSFALRGKPYMGVGRNLAYRKELFYKYKGFSSHLNLQAGEDDLFVNEFAVPRRTQVELSPESITCSNMEDSNLWEEIKTNSTITQRYYKRGPVAFWRFEYMSRLIFFAAVVASIIYGLSGIILPAAAAGLFIIRSIILFSVINKSAAALQTERFYFTLPLFDIFQPFVNAYFFMGRAFKGKRDYNWR